MFSTWNFVLRLVSIIQDSKSFLSFTSLLSFMTSFFLPIRQKFGKGWKGPFESRQAIFPNHTSKISCSLIDQQLLHSTPACGYKFHALPVHLHPAYAAPPIGQFAGIHTSSLIKIEKILTYY